MVIKLAQKEFPAQMGEFLKAQGDTHREKLATFVQGPYADSKSTKMSSSTDPQVYNSAAMELQASLEITYGDFNKFKRETLDDIKKMTLPTACRDGGGATLSSRACRESLDA